MMTSQQAAISQNNEAVFLIATGNYAAAITSLSNALDTFRHLMHATSDQSECDAASTSSLDACMKEGLQPYPESIPQEYGQNYLYQRAIPIPQVQRRFTYQENAMASCIVVFNLALSHHLSSSWMKAIKLYELSFNIQLEEEFENNVLFTLAVVNNLGIVHRMLCDGEASGKCFEHVLSTLMLLTDCGQGNMCHLDGFFVNVTSLISEPSVAAAA
jgi:hypothetical protein